jgi:hypothetical protein
MKTIGFLPVLIFLAVFAWVLPVAGTSPADSGKITQTSTPTTEELARRYPVAPGVWYPTDGPIPAKVPMRYYRVRCWPGCHSGSANGKYKDRSLELQPLFPTSAASAHRAMPALKE